MKTLKLTIVCGLLTSSLVTPSLAAMGDDPILGKVIFDKLETSDASGSAPFNWELDAWVGQDLNKVWLKSEGERIDRENEQSNELLFSRAISPFWDIQFGFRRDRSDGVNRDFLKIGAQGLAPYLFDTSTSILIGENDQIGLDAQFEYELMLTQRWVLTPEIELDFWSENDPEIGIGSGLSTAEISLRLSYAIQREFAPYIGLSWSKQYGKTADFARIEGEDSSSAQFVVGVRAWF